MIEVDKTYYKIQKTLKKYGYHPYKITPTQKLTERHKEERVEFCQTMINRLHQDNDFLKNILWTDEATFSTSGIFNRKNTNFWARQNPHQIREIKVQGRRSVHVWCGILNNTVIGPIIFNENLNGEVYLQYLNNEIEHMLEDLPIAQYNRIVWQQDGAPPHNIRAVTEVLNDRYQLWLGRHGVIHWPANSPDLTPLDNFLWGFLKDRIYADSPDDLDVVIQQIRQSIEYLNQEKPHFIQDAIQRLRRCYQLCIEQEGGHFQQY